MAKMPKKIIRPWQQKRVKHQRSVDMSWFYNTAKWRKFSKAYKQRHPLCVQCEKNGIIKQSEVTDHVVRFAHGGKGFDLDNLKDEYFQPLCKKCHDSKSGREAHGFKGGMG